MRYYNTLTLFVVKLRKCQQAYKCYGFYNMFIFPAHTYVEVLKRIWPLKVYFSRQLKQDMFRHCLSRNERSSV